MTESDKTASVLDTQPVQSTPNQPAIAQDVEAIPAETFAKVKDQLHKENRENRSLKQQLTELTEKLNKITDKEKSDLERAQAQAQAASTKLAELEARAAHAERKASVLGHGCDPEYADEIADRLARAKKDNPDIDDGDFLKDLKKRKPLLFGVHQTEARQAPGSGNGTPVNQSQNAKTAEIAKLEEEFNKAKGNEKIYLMRALKKARSA